MLGLAVGPLVGVMVDRAVERVGPAAEHRCVKCQAGLGVWSLIPILGWFSRCPTNPAHRSIRYPIVDVSSMVGFGLITYRFGSDWMLAPYLALVCVLVALAVIDAETHLLPNIIMWPSIWVGLFMVLTVSGFTDYSQGLKSALVASAMATGLIGAAHLVYEAGMGRGDVKLALLLGLFVGWPQTEILQAVRLTFATLIVALLGVGVGGGIYNLVRRRGRAEIAFGPALIGAAIAIIVMG